jgi:uncharacterized protein YecE (DUF72 family)
MPIYVGTSGYYYKEWIGPVYPEGTHTGNMLETYSGMFDAVEINATFYRPPAPDMFRNYPKRTGGHVKVVVKLNSRFTHERDAGPPDADLFKEAVKPIENSGQFVAYLAQFPQSFHNTRDARDHIENLRAMFPNHSLVVEFRHKDWWKQDVLEFLKDLGVSMCTVDVPDIPGLPPTGATYTADPAYYRLHGRNKDGWYEGREERYTYNYERSELEEILLKVRKLSLRSDLVLLSFNNHPYGYSAMNAKEFVNILMQAMPDAMPPPGTASEEDTDQMSLF